MIRNVWVIAPLLASTVLVPGQRIFGASRPHSLHRNQSKYRYGTHPVARHATGHLEIESANRLWRGLGLGQFGNLMFLMTTDGQVRRVELDGGTRVRKLNSRFRPARHMELSAQLRSEFGSDYSILRRAHYVICHNTDKAFAKQTGELAEDLYAKFMLYFTARGIRLSKPRFPMVIIVFDTEEQFRSHLQRSASQPHLRRLAGYYSMETNRIVTFNAARGGAAKFGKRNVNWQNLSTVVHEATHQIAFNTGCLQRFADHPLWIVEGMAMYFEAPELRGQKLVWNEAGNLNVPRLRRFMAYRKKRRDGKSLRSLVLNDDRFGSEEHAGDAYAESWALAYFLTNTRSAASARYMKTLAARKPFEAYSPEARLADFQKAFGRNLAVLDASFIRHMDRLAKSKLAR